MSLLALEYRSVSQTLPVSLPRLTVTTATSGSIETPPDFDSIADRFRVGRSIG